MGINLYKSTLIPYLIPTAVVIAISFVAFKINYKHFKQLFSKMASVFMKMLAVSQCLSIGFMACTLFLSINYYLADEKPEKGVYKITSRDYRTSVNRNKGVTYQKESRVPWFEIDYHGQPKLIPFNKNEYIYMNGYTHIEMEIKKCFLGHDILLNKKLIAK